MNILIVDDEPLVRSSITRMIRKYKPEYIVEEAEDGEDALEQLSHYPHDLVITDIRMPMIDGLELASSIHQRFPETLVVMLTGYAEFDYAVTALQQKAFDYLLKPASKEKIIDVIIKAEEVVLKNKAQKQIAMYRERNMLEKRVHDLFYELPVPYFDEVLFPRFQSVVVISYVPDKELQWKQPIHFPVKNVLADVMAPHGMPVVIVEESQVTSVLFSDHSEWSEPDIIKLAEEVRYAIQSLLKINLRLGIGGVSGELSAITSLYQQSLRALNLVHAHSVQKPSESVHRLIRAAMEQIQQDYSSDLTLVALAEKLYINPNYLSGLFKTETGHTFTHHLTQARIQHAKRLLKETNLKIYQICDEVGYMDQAYFSRLFKATEGMSPYEYRERT